LAVVEIEIRLNLHARVIGSYKWNNPQSMVPYNPYEFVANAANDYPSPIVHIGRKYFAWPRLRVMSSRINRALTKPGRNSTGLNLIIYFWPPSVTVDVWSWRQNLEPWIFV